MKTKIINKINKNKLSILIFGVLLGIISSFALPPYNFYFLNFFVFPSLFFISILHNCNKKYLFFLGLSFGFGYFFSSLYWISNSLIYDESFKFLIPISLVVIPLFLSFFYGIAFLILSFLKIYLNFSSILFFSIIFSFLEYTRGTIFTGFPWNLTVFSLAKLINSIQILSFLGTYTLNLFTITLFLIPSIIFFKIKTQTKILFSCLVLILLTINNLYGISRANKFTMINDHVLDYKIIIVSPKIDLIRYFSAESPTKKIDELIKISDPDKNAKTLFIFSEGILSGIFLDDLQNYKSKFSQNFSSKHKMIFGINSEENSKIYNSLALLDSELNVLTKYNKNNLVPFGEFLPFEKFLSKFGLKKITQGYNSFSYSKKRDLIIIEGYKFLPLICYEIIYSGKLNRNFKDFNFIINISEDGWFGNSIGPHQHFVHSIFRAIEEGKNVFRSSNNGISAHLNPVGKIEDKIESTQSGVIEVQKVKFSERTYFSKHGNKIFFYFLIIYITFASFLKRKDL